MISIHYAIVTLFFFLFSMTFPILGYCPCLAENVDNQGPRVSLDIYFLPEKKACRDKGYVRYDQDTKSNCKLWKYDEIGKLKQYLVERKIEVPPEPIQLSQNLYDRLLMYHNTNKDNVDRRKCILMVFEFGQPQNGLLTFKRIVDPKDTKIPPYPEPVEEEFYGTHFIHHERADAFSPGQKITWRLTIGKFKWEFYTLRPK